MPTIQQLVRSARQKMTNKTKAPALKSCPQRRAFVLCLLQTKKPNSAHAKLRVYSNTGFVVTAIFQEWPQLRKHWLS
jgi:small subunit ribosomal protein S12